MIRNLLLSLVIFGSLPLYANNHHEREKIKIEFAEHHHHNKQKGIGRMFFDGSVQLVENNAYLLSFGGAAAFVAYAHSKRGALEIVAPVAVVGWLGGGMITRSIARVIMAQADIKKI